MKAGGCLVTDECSNGARDLSSSFEQKGCKSNQTSGVTEIYRLSIEINCIQRLFFKLFIRCHSILKEHINPNCFDNDGDDGSVKIIHLNIDMFYREWY